MTNALLTKFENYRLALVYQNIIVLDTETTLINKNKGKSIYNDPPKFLMWKHANWHNLVANDPTDFIMLQNMFFFSARMNPVILVGHNLPFDAWIAVNENGRVTADPPRSHETMWWDTALATYLLSNQELRSPSLNESLEYFKLDVRKDDEVSSMIKAGICPSTIDPAKLLAYLEQDVLVTRDLFFKQKELFDSKPKPWQNMFINQMLFLQQTFRASVNGIATDKDFIAAEKAKLEDRFEFLTGYLQESMRITSGQGTAEDWNPSSNDDLKTVLYGGYKKIEERVANGVYKTGAKAGQTKYRKHTKILPINGSIFTPSHDDERVSVDEAALKQLLVTARSASHGMWITFLEHLLEYRDVVKNLKTYFEGYMDYADDNGFIHPQFHHTRTPTGRLTCTNPNLQNIKS